MSTKGKQLMGLETNLIVTEYTCIYIFLSFKTGQKFINSLLISILTLFLRWCMTSVDIRVDKGTL